MHEGRQVFRSVFESFKRVVLQNSLCVLLVAGIFLFCSSSTCGIVLALSHYRALVQSETLTDKLPVEHSLSGCIHPTVSLLIAVRQKLMSSNQIYLSLH